MVQVNDDVLDEYEKMTMDFIIGDFGNLIGKGIILSFDNDKVMRRTCAFKYFKWLIDDNGVNGEEHKVYDIKKNN